MVRLRVLPSLYQKYQIHNMEYFVAWKDDMDKDWDDGVSVTANCPSEAAMLAMRRETMDNPEIEAEYLGEESRVMTVHALPDGCTEERLESDSDILAALTKQEPAGTFKCEFIPAHVNVMELIVA